MEKILASLNDSQKEAVLTIDGPILILAGAGSGKTKTITARLAYLLANGIDPANTLTLTFTNKASQEMKYRALSMIKEHTHTPPLLVTFHKFGLLFLKLYIHMIGRENNFVIIDTDDKKRIIKSIDTSLSASMVGSEISTLKNHLISPTEALSSKTDNRLVNKIASIYAKYEEHLAKNNLVDFDDLLVLPYKILLTDDAFAQAISTQYQYIMVDEYQDTNDIQYKLLKVLSASHNNICVVGDDDQSIYGWRGANINNILNFSKEFENTKTIKLENNYRSTSSILKVANELIEHNRNRLGKTLKSTKEIGEEVTLYESFNEIEESSKIAKHIKKLLASGVKANQIAILFRVNALSRSIEEGLNKEGVAYKLIGGLRFYERAEIKDLISYFRLISNYEDDFSLKRIINKPKRGIGKATLEKIEQLALSANKSILNYLLSTNAVALNEYFGQKISKEFMVFAQTIADLKIESNKETMLFIDKFEEATHFIKSYEGEADEADRVANIFEFYGYYRDYIKENPMNTLEDFLNDLALQSDQDQIGDEYIYLMSVHASKGLEFDYVFVIGLEEGFFPIIGDNIDIEEERRLGYVAFTRAKDVLVASFAKSRLYKGKRTDLIKSQFLKESGLVKGSLSINKSSGFKNGDVVKHKLFGMGRVLSVAKAGSDFKLKIDFGTSQREILSSFVEKF